MRFSRNNPVIADDVEPLDVLLDYHQRSRHQYLAYAKGPETLDWDNQPNPFRHYDSAHRVPLPLTDAMPVQSKTLSLLQLSAMLRYGLGLTAWKSYGPDKWSLRANPSSGNLHPTETYLINTGAISDLDPGVYHYDVLDHQLEKRARINTGLLSCSDKTGFYLGFSSVLFREAWKYGERSFRYSQLDIGHALASVMYSCRLLGWNTYWLPVASKFLADLLGLQRDEFSSVEKEHPEILVYISANGKSPSLNGVMELEGATDDWQGQPSLLTVEPGPYKWPWVDKAAALTEVTDIELGVPMPATPMHLNTPFVGTQLDDISVLIKRRSAQRFAQDPISLEQFQNFLEVLSGNKQSILSALGSEYQLNYLITINRVDGIEPGLYLFVNGHLNHFQRTTVTRFFARENQENPIRFGENLIPLQYGDYQQVVATLNCQQRLGSDCAFNLSFMVNLKSVLENHSLAHYRYVHWQAGVIAHQFYLQATASGLAATGVGCFFDEPWQKVLKTGWGEMDFLYHVAVGHPIVDERITSLPGYQHLCNRKHS